MNQHQRKFLLEQIEKLYKSESIALNNRKPSAPSLNNYLIAAILDGSVKMQPPNQLQESIRKRVRDLGKNESLIGSYSRWERDSGEDCIAIPALLMFEMPHAYAEEMENYQKAIAAWNSEAAALEASINAMRIKIQVGSDEALSAQSSCRMSHTSRRADK